MRIRKRTDLIVIHCSATRPLQDIGADEIRQWHTSPPRNWNDIGYHFVIRRNGAIEKGRDMMAVGAHAGGHQTNAAGEKTPLYNEISVGICMVGGVDADDVMKAEDNFTDAQKIALKTALEMLRTIWPKAKIIGHREISVIPKACPSFEVSDWLRHVGISN